jgi:hypothetical protein
LNEANPACYAAPSPFVPGSVSLLDMLAWAVINKFGGCR